MVADNKNQDPNEDPQDQDPAKQDDDTSDVGKRDEADTDELVEEWGEESFPASDPPANY